MFHEYYSIPKCFEELWNNIRAEDSQLRLQDGTTETANAAAGTN